MFRIATITTVLSAESSGQIIFRPDGIDEFERLVLQTNEKVFAVIDNTIHDWISAFFRQKTVLEIDQFHQRLNDSKINWLFDPKKIREKVYKMQNNEGRSSIASRYGRQIEDENSTRLRSDYNEEYQQI